MRIIGGRLRGARLAAPPAGDRTIRPTADRVREAIFNLLAHRPEGDPVPGARVLDLFAGTGALGLEAVSRGAATALLVERAARAADLIGTNIARLGLGETAQLMRRDVTRLGPCPFPPFDLVFLDPPYGRGLGERAFAAAAAGGWIAADALVVWEENAPIVPAAGLTLIDSRRYGETMISLFRMA